MNAATTSDPEIPGVGPDDWELLSDAQIRKRFEAANMQIDLGPGCRTARQIIGLRALHLNTKEEVARRINCIRKLTAIVRIHLPASKTRPTAETVRRIIEDVKAVQDEMRGRLSLFLRSGDPGLIITGQARALDNAERKDGPAALSEQVIALCENALRANTLGVYVSTRILLNNLLGVRKWRGNRSRVSTSENTAENDHYGIYRLAKLLDISQRRPAGIARALHARWGEQGITSPSFQAVYAWLIGNWAPRSTTLTAVFEASLKCVTSDDKRKDILALARTCGIEMNS